MRRTPPLIILVVLAVATASAAAATTADRTAPRVVITGLPTHGCTHRVKFTVDYDDSSGIGRVQIFFDGKLAGRGKGRQPIHVRLGPVRSGRHRLGAIVYDAAGNKGRAVRRFRVC